MGYLRQSDDSGVRQVAWATDLANAELCTPIKKEVALCGTGSRVQFGSRPRAV